MSVCALHPVADLHVTEGAAMDHPRPCREWRARQCGESGGADGMEARPSQSIRITFGSSVST